MGKGPLRRHVHLHLLPPGWDARLLHARPFTREQKQVRFDGSGEVSNRISGEKHREYEGTIQRVLVDGDRQENTTFLPPTAGGWCISGPTKASSGQFINVKIKPNTWALYGEPVK